MPLTVVVTGATGFVGRHVLELLRVRRGIRVIAVSRREMAGADRIGSYVDTPHGDVLIHLAEESDRSRAEQLGRTYEEDSSRAINALLNKGFRRIVYASSAVLYGDSDPKAHATNDPILAEGNTYVRVKRSAELAVLGSGIGVVARLSNLYGHGMSESNVLSTILRQVPGEGLLKVMDVSPVRDFLWVDDAAAGFVQLALCDGAAGRAGGLYNLGTGVGVSIGTLARRVLDLAGQSDRQVVEVHPCGRESVLILDCARTFEDCGWQAETSLDTGIRRLLEKKAGN